jgi:DNA repair exonuclease SbcCD ATPase subunit
MNPGFQERLGKLKADIGKVKAYRDVLRSQIVVAKEESERLRYNAELDQKSSELFKAWLEDLLRNNVDSISELVTSGLRFVIHDQELTFRIHQEPKYNRLSMNFVIEEDGVEGDPMASFGGGAVVIASLILRLAVMARMGMGDLLLLDESMFALANKYVPAAAEFMRQLAERTGVNILMVTHNDEFMDNAHVAYDARSVSPPGGGRNYLSLRRRAGGNK